MNYLFLSDNKNAPVLLLENKRLRLMKGTKMSAYVIWFRNEPSLENMYCTRRDFVM